MRRKMLRQQDRSRTWDTSDRNTSADCGSLAVTVTDIEGAAFFSTQSTSRLSRLNVLGIGAVGMDFPSPSAE